MINTYMEKSMRQKLIDIAWAVAGCIAFATWGVLLAWRG